MKKTTIINVILLLAVLFSGSAMAAIELGAVNDVPLAGITPNQAANQYTISLDIKNTDVANAITVIPVMTDDFKNGAQSIAKVQLPAEIAIAAGATQTLTITVNVPRSQLPGIYASQVRVSDKAGVLVEQLKNIDISVLSFKELTLNPVTLNVIGQAGEAALYSQEITLQNTGSEQLTITPEVVFGVEKNQLTFDNEKVTFSFEEKVGDAYQAIAGNLVIGPATSKVVRVKANAVGVSTSYATAAGKFNAVNSLNVIEVLKSADLSIKLGDQGICKLGPQNSGKVILDSNSDIQDEVEDEEYRIGDKVTFSFDVKNKLGEDADIEVEAVLYNLDTDNVISSESDSKTIDNNEEETFEFELELTPKDIKGEDNIVLLIKAYADDNAYTENNYCSEDSYNIDLQQDDVDLRIEEFQVLPPSVEAGEQIEVVANILNYGKDQTSNVRLKVKNAELKLDVESERYSLEEYTNKDNDDEQRVRLPITIPSDAKAKEYELQVYAISPDGESTMEIVKLTVEGEAEKVAEKPVTQSTTKTTTTVTRTEVPAITGAAVGTNVQGSTLADKSIFDSIKRTSDLPLLFWIILDLVLVFVIVTVILLVARKRK